jgi:amidophosphoribosyltransferase
MCGVIGVTQKGDKHNVGFLVFNGLMALQHRGQEAAGITWPYKERIFVYKDIGMVNTIFDDNLLSQMKSKLSIGHVRYPTTKTQSWESSQPILHSKYDLALAHNGHIDSIDILRELTKLTTGDKNHTQATKLTDSNLLLNFLATSYNKGKFDITKLIELLGKVKGAYSILLMNKFHIYCIRDPYGYRPLSLGILEDNSGLIVASESSAIKQAKGRYLREVKEGEILKLQGDQIETLGILPKRKPISRRCSFEHVYIAKADSKMDGLSVYAVRERLGFLLGEKFKAAGSKADIVVPVPDSAIPYALGFSKATDIPYEQPIIKNRYVGRSFIEPNNGSRMEVLKSKFAIIEHLIEGKSLAIVDDSIVRGNTQKFLIKLLKSFSPKEIHVCVGSPPIRHECYYGVDIANKNELIANKNSITEIANSLGVTSLTYLTLLEMQIAFGENAKNRFCFSCITGYNSKS